MAVFIIAILWLGGIIGATIFLYRRNSSTTSSELLETIITQNNYPPIGDILAWSKENKIRVDYKGMLK